MIPLVDLHAQYLEIKQEVDLALKRVISASAFVGGEEVVEFEKEFAAFCGVKACVCVNSGTDALYLALRALGLKPGDEVITVAHTFIATAEAISLTGANPVFVDIREDTMLMDPDALEAAITSRTRAIVPVHLYGHPCEMDRIMNVAQRYGLRVVEDAAQAHGAVWQGRRVGSFGDAACFSFFPGKNLGAYGDGGAVVSRSEELIGHIRMLANHGRREKYTHEIEGINSRLDGLQAAILRVKLPHLHEWNAVRRRHAMHYFRCLHDTNILVPVAHCDAECVWHLFVVRVHDRERFEAHLKANGIATGIHYPLPLHQQPAYKHLEAYNGKLQVTEKVAAEVVSLPMYAELTDDQVEYICRAVTAL